METIRKVLEKLQDFDFVPTCTVRINSVYDFDEGYDMWQGLVKDIPEKLLDSVVCMMDVKYTYPENEVEKITFEVPEEDLHLLQELDDNDKTNLEKFLEKFRECSDMWNALVKNTPKNLLEEIIFRGIPEDLHAALEEFEEESESSAEEFDDECLPWESIVAPEKSVETIDNVLVFRKEDGDKFYEYTTVYFDRETNNLLIVCDGANMDFESEELNENMVQLTTIGEKKLQVLVPGGEPEFIPPKCAPGLPFSDEEGGDE